MAGLHKLDGSVVLITGAAGALGSATARSLAAAGVRLALVDREGFALDALAAELEGSAALPCDLLEDADVLGLVDRVEKQLGPLDGVVSCAGVEFNHRFHSSTWTDLDRQLSIHLRGPMMLLHSALPGMLERGRGQMVVVSSMNGKLPFPAKVPYAAAKAGSIAMTHALRREYDGTGVGFSVVLPTLVTGAGQAARAIEGAGVSPPRTAPTCTTDQCAQAIVDALRQGKGEYTVSSRPVGPVAGLQWSNPGLADQVLKLSGMPKFWMALAE